MTRKSTSAVLPSDADSLLNISQTGPRNEMPIAETRHITQYLPPCVFLFCHSATVLTFPGPL